MIFACSANCNAPRNMVATATDWGPGWGSNWTQWHLHSTISENWFLTQPCQHDFQIWLNAQHCYSVTCQRVGSPSSSPKAILGDCFRAFANLRHLKELPSYLVVFVLVSSQAWSLARVMESVSPVHRSWQLYYNWEGKQKVNNLQRLLTVHDVFFSTFMEIWLLCKGSCFMKSGINTNGWLWCMNLIMLLGQVNMTLIFSFAF